MRVVQLLNWKLKTIEGILDDIERQGFDTIQINPMQPFKDENEFHWWSSYQPFDFDIGNRFGTEQDLQKLCAEAKKRGIDIIVDIVFNHMANKSGYEQLTPHNNVNPKLRDNQGVWKQPIMLQNGDNRYEAVRHNIGLPGLNYANEELQTMLLDYLMRLKQLGVSGFRFDAAKHIGLPNDGVNFFNVLKRFLENNNLYAYGEFLGGDLNWRNEFSNYLDVLTNYSVMVSDIDKHVSFLESHDSYFHNDYYSTRCIKTGELNNLYKLLTSKFPKTLYYVRALNKPYFEEGNNVNNYGLSFEQMNELNYFDTSFLTEEKIREANHTSNDSKVYVKKPIW